jgi:hypothetical protein
VTERELMTHSKGMAGRQTVRERKRYQISAA